MHLSLCFSSLYWISTPRASHRWEKRGKEIRAFLSEGMRMEIALCRKYEFLFTTRFLFRLIHLVPLPRIAHLLLTSPKFTSSAVKQYSESQRPRMLAGRCHLTEEIRGGGKLLFYSSQGLQHSFQN